MISGLNYEMNEHFTKRKGTWAYNYDNIEKLISIRKRAGEFNSIKASITNNGT
jgi:hypothetical protein